MNTEIPKGWLEGWDRLLVAVHGHPAHKPPPTAPREARTLDEAFGLLNQMVHQISGGCEHGPWIFLGETKDGMESAYRCARCGLEVLQ